MYLLHTVFSIHKIQHNFFKVSEKMKKVETTMDTDLCLLPCISCRVGPLKLWVENTFMCHIYFRVPGRTQLNSPGPCKVSVQSPDSDLCSVGDINWLIVYLNEAMNGKWVVATEYTSNRKWPLCSTVPRTTCRWMFSKCFLMIAVLRKTIPLREGVGFYWQGHETYRWEKLSGLWIVT